MNLLNLTSLWLDIICQVTTKCAWIGVARLTKKTKRCYTIHTSLAWKGLTVWAAAHATGSTIIITPLCQSSICNLQRLVSSKKKKLAKSVSCIYIYGLFIKILYKITREQNIWPSNLTASTPFLSLGIYMGPRKWQVSTSYFEIVTENFVYPKKTRKFYSSANQCFIDLFFWNEEEYITDE